MKWNHSIYTFKVQYNTRLTSGIPVLYLVACVRNIIICNDS